MKLYSLQNAEDELVAGTIDTQKDGTEEDRIRMDGIFFTTQED